MGSFSEMRSANNVIAVSATEATLVADVDETEGIVVSLSMQDDADVRSPF